MGKNQKQQNTKRVSFAEEVEIIPEAEEANKNTNNNKGGSDKNPNPTIILTK